MGTRPVGRPPILDARALALQEKLDALSAENERLKSSLAKAGEAFRIASVRAEMAESSARGAISRAYASFAALAGTRR
jgi:hypothetical protein